MLRQYTRKEKEVEEALGEARGDCLEASRRMTKGNKAIIQLQKSLCKGGGEANSEGGQQRVVWP